MWCKMEGEDFTVIQNFGDDDDLDLTSADLSTIIEVPTLEPFILTNENVLGNINPLDVGHGGLLDNLNDMDLHLECDDDRNYDMNDVKNKSNFLPTALVGNNVQLHISFSNNTSIKQEQDLKDKFVCSFCFEKFKIETKYCRHMLHTHQSTKPFQCESCSYAAHSSRLLTKHVKRRHIKSEKNEKLEDSTDEFYTIAKEETVCSEEVNSNIGMNDSKLDEKNKPEKDISTEGVIYKCNHCNYTCKHKAYLNSHSKRHVKTNDFKFHCLTCNKKFQTSVSLKRHAKTHTEIRSYVCQYKNCNKSFKIKGALTDHERYIHGKSKIKNDNLNENGIIVKNTEETSRKSIFRMKQDRKFKCTFSDCGKLFRDSYNLRNHMAIHTGVKELSCPLCSFTCVQKASLKWHLKSKHNK